VNAATNAIIKAIARGDIDTAQEAFRTAAHKTSVGQAARAVCEATPPPAGTIIVGPALLVWANPFRDDYGWRCGNCRWTASTYKTRRNAEKSANKHAGEHPGIKVRWITRPAGA
jgi:hypothetical protein